MLRNYLCLQALLAQSAAAGGDGGRAAGTRALVVVPTRELATQSHEVLQALCPPWLVTSCLTGGERKKSEKARLRKGVGVLVATPGRVADHLRSTAAFVVSACPLPYCALYNLLAPARPRWYADAKDLEYAKGVLRPHRRGHQPHPG